MLLKAKSWKIHSLKQALQWKVNVCSKIKDPKRWVNKKHAIIANMKRNSQVKDEKKKRCDRYREAEKS